MPKRKSRRGKKIVQPRTDNATAQHDAFTVAAIAIIVYALSTLLHEGLGHGGACFLMHGAPRQLSSMSFDCSVPLDGASNADRIVAAGGTIATLIGGLLALALYHLGPGSNVWRYTLWLFAAVNLMQGTGYLLYSGVGNIGDWAQVIDEWRPAWAWRAGLACAGLVLYVSATLWLFRSLDPFVGAARPRRFRHALRLAVLPYAIGGLLELAAGVLNPGGVALVLVSGIAASFGGTSGLVWGPQTLRGKRTPSSLLEIPVGLVGRNWGVIVLAVGVAAGFILVFGPGLTFRR